MQITALELHKRQVIGRGRPSFVDTLIVDPGNRSKGYCDEITMLPCGHFVVRMDQHEDIVPHGNVKRAQFVRTPAEPKTDTKPAKKTAEA